MGECTGRWTVVIPNKKDKMAIKRLTQPSTPKMEWGENGCADWTLELEDDMVCIDDFTYEIPIEVFLDMAEWVKSVVKKPKKS